MTNALVYHVASGQAFFSGLFCLHLAVLLAFSATNRWWALGRTVLACTGLILIAVSGTPLPGWFYVITGSISLAWIGLEGTSRVTWESARRRVRYAVLAIWWLGLAIELPYHLTPALPRLSDPPLAIIGDSITAGMGGGSETWPKILARQHGVVVIDRSLAGATVASAMEQAEGVSEPGALVLVEIGGNDILGETTPEAFERGLDALLARLRTRHRSVVLLELPLPPFFNRYGAIQRRLARHHGVVLVPKRILLGVLTTGDATLDSIHLSQAGHVRMARAMWEILRPAFGR